MKQLILVPLLAALSIPPAAIGQAGGNCSGNVVGGQNNSQTNDCRMFLRPLPAPRPRIKVVSVEEHDNADGSHTLIQTMRMSAPYAGMLAFSVRAAGLIDADVGSTAVRRIEIPGNTLFITGGGAMQLFMVKMDNFFSVTIPQPAGEYRVTVNTKTKTSVVITTNFSQ